MEEPSVIEGEIWELFNGLYYVSNHGRIWSIHYFKLMKMFVNPGGYCCAPVLGASSKLVHRLVGDVFLTKPDIANIQINHKNGIKTDNRIENLEWCTYSHNLKHAREIGLNPSLWGEGRKKSSLKNEDVLLIVNSSIKTKDLAEKYSVSTNAICDIKAGRSWNHITNIPLTRIKK